MRLDEPGGTLTTSDCEKRNIVVRERRPRSSYHWNDEKSHQQKGKDRMNHRYICTAVIVAGTLIASFALAEDASQKTDPGMEEMIKKAEAAGTPGAAHKALEPLVGNWTAEVKSWMTPGAPPTVSQATAKSTWVMNGRFVQQEFTGDFMGKPFRGVGLTGYDNTKKKYSNVWIDDMHTSMFTSEGEGENNVITLEGKYDCPITDRKDLPMKQVLLIVSQDKHVFEMHDPTKGSDSKTMEITYTRK